MNTRFFDLARKISKLSNHERHKLGAVIIRGSKIVSIGVNNLKTHPRSTHPYSSLHAEMAAVVSAKQDLNKCEIYVYRETKEGIPAMARPCVYCFPFIQEAGLKFVHYSIDGNYKTERI